MSQLITTTDISTIRPVFTQGASENIKRYNQLKKLFEEFKEYRVFAEPVPAGGQKIAWHTDFQGNVTPFTQLSESEQEIVKGRLKYQVNQMYKAVLRILKNTDKNASELFELLDSCIEIPNYKDIYVIQSSSGQKNFCIIRWGFTSDEFNAERGLIEKLIPVKVNTIPVHAILANNKNAKGEKITIEFLGKTIESVTDNDGKVYLEDIPFFTKITAFQTDKKGDRKNIHNYVCDERDEYLFRIGVPYQNIVFKLIDNQGRSIKNTTLYFEYLGNKIQINTDENGKVILKDIPIGTEIKAIQNKNISNSYTCEDGIKEYTILGEQPVQNVIIKVIDENRLPVKNAVLKISFQEQLIERDSDENGLIGIGLVNISEKISCAQIIDNKEFNKQDFICEKNKEEYVFTGKKPVTVGLMNFLVLNEQKNPIPNALIKIEYNGKTIDKTSDNNGRLSIENIPFGAKIKCLQIIDGVAKHQHTFVNEQGKSEYIIRGSLPKPESKYANVQVQIINRKKEPIPNLKITCDNGYKTTNLITDDTGKVTFSDINCADAVNIHTEYKGIKKDKKFFCVNETEFHQIVIGKKRFLFLFWLIPLLLLLAALFYFFLLPLLIADRVVVVDTLKVIDTTHVIDTVKPPLQKGLIIKVLDKDTKKPIQNADVVVEFENKSLKLKTDNEGIINIENISENVPEISTIINAEGYTEQRATFQFIKEKIFYLSDESLDVSEVILPCGELVESKGYGSTIKTFSIKKSSGNLSILFDMFEIADELIVYQGKASEISDDKIIWKTSGYVSRLHKEYFPFTAPDSLITVKINGGDETKTEWYFRVYCP